MDLKCIDHISGWLSLPEAAFLAGLAGQVPVGQAIVEIGTYCGRSAVALAHGARPGVRVYAVDPHLEGIPTCPDPGPKQQAELYRHIVDSEKGEIISVVSLRSAEAAAAWKVRGEPIGMLWIDGCHTYEAVRTDLDCWLPMVVSDGIVVVHDVLLTAEFPGIGRAVAETPSILPIAHCGSAVRYRLV